MRRLAALLVLLPLLLSGCGGSSPSAAPIAGAASATPGTSGSATSDPLPSTDSSADPASASCPSDNTRSFAKTRFVADLGGAAFLIRRYLYQPYQAGKFTKGASGRTVALVKAGTAAAASVKLLNNATKNAKANPTLCRTVAAPLSDLSRTLSSLTTGSLRNGSIDPSVLGGLSGAVTSLLAKAGKAGVPVTERPVGLGG